MSIPATDSAGLIRLNLSRQIAARLRDDIVHGIIPPGTHLVQDDLCRRFGTSRMPVRDALQQLTYEGLLINRSGKREVVKLGQEEIAETQKIIGILNGWAAGRVAEFASEDEINELSQLFEQIANTWDPLEFSQLSLDAHRQINLLARSPMLIRTILMLQQSVPRVFPMSGAEHMEVMRKAHNRIIAAIQGRNVEAAESLTRQLSLDFIEWFLEGSPGPRRQVTTRISAEKQEAAR